MSKYNAKMRYCNKWIYGKLIDDKFLKLCIADELEGKRAKKTKAMIKELVDND